jgi:hypothetical protein
MNLNTILVIAASILAVYIVFKILKTLVKWVIIIGLVVLVIAFLSNPKEADHRSQLKALIPDVSVKIKDNAIQVDDYQVFSVTKVTVDGKERIAGVGAFGKVWYFDDIKAHFKKR